MLDELRDGDRPVGEAARDRAGWPDDWDKRDQVAAVADALTEPRSASWVAEQADVAPKTARKHLQRLVDDGTLTTETAEDGTTRYRPDPKTLVFEKLRALSDRSRAELTAELQRIADEIEAWQADYGVESPAALRATIDEELSDAERRQRRRDAYDWERNEALRQLVRLALQFHEEIEAAVADQRTTAPTGERVGNEG